MTWTDFDTAAVDSLFFLGHVPGHEDRPISYPRDPKQRSHLAYYGTTRSGKTYAIEYVLRQIADDRSAGFCFIDPHASGYWRMASYLREHGITDRVLFWDINGPEYVVTFDPFDVPDQSPAYIAGNLTSAILATLGQQPDPSKQALLKTMTERGLLALITLHLPFLMTQQLFNPEDQAFKRAVHNRVGAGMLGAIAELPKLLDRYREVGPSYRRFDNLFLDERLRLTFSGSGVNFRELMDEGYIVLVNTEPKDQSDEATTLFTRLLVKSFFMAAKQREKSDDTPPFFLVIDEASRYLTKDTAGILAQTAGYGLYLIAGMQGLEQARLEDEATYIALRENVGSEVVMRLLDYEEKIYWTRRFFGDYLDLGRVKETATAAIPRTVDHTTRSRTTTTSRDDRDRTASAEGDTETPGQHVEYEYEEVPISYFTTDELEREAAREFGMREEGKGQRFGVVRVNEGRPCKIEIPELDPPEYRPKEMIDWLRAFKQTQPATMPLVEARTRVDAQLSEHLQLLALTPEASKDDEQRRPTTTGTGRKLKPRPKAAPKGTDRPEE